jgi:hypothetical protein
VGALLVSLAVLTVAAVPSPAAAAPDKEIITNDDPKAGTNAGIEREREQEPLILAAATIMALDPKREGLAGVRLQTEQRTVEVYWKGEVPDPVAEEIKRQQEAGITIALGRADYSGSELTAAMNQLADQQQERYPAVSLLFPQVEGTGLLAYVNDLAAARKYDFGLPVELVPAKDPVPLFSRFADTPPFWAGAAAFANGGRCSTGFAVHKTFFGIETSRGLLTAGHCDKAGGSTFVTGGSLTIGSSAGPLSVSDSSYIVGRSAGRMYDGGVGVGEFSRSVVGTFPNLPGNVPGIPSVDVCTSGASTGAHCAITNLLVGGVVFLTPGVPTFGITLAAQRSGLVAAGQGDSGGPVVVPLGTTSALATGMIDFGLSPTTCPSGVGLCSSVIGYVDINWVLASNIGMSLVP